MTAVEQGVKPCNCPTACPKKGGVDYHHWECPFRRPRMDLRVWDLKQQARKVAEEATR